MTKNSSVGACNLMWKYPGEFHGDLQTRERPLKTRGNRQYIDAMCKRFTRVADPNQVPREEAPNRV
jgi:hypothetical protein